VGGRIRFALERWDSARHRSYAAQLFSLGCMSAQHPHGIGPAGRWYIFSGIPFAAVAIFQTAIAPSLDHFVGQRADSYVDLLIIAAIVVAALILYDHVPQKLVLPLGIVGWIIAFSLLYWYFWFGPGAFGHHQI
jgi:hypothetical protein